jgi:hypothetical protein
LSPEFVSGKAGKRFVRKFKRSIHLVDSTTIPLIASCLDWARHRLLKSKKPPRRRVAISPRRR